MIIFKTIYGFKYYLSYENSIIRWEGLKDNSEPFTETKCAEILRILKRSNPKEKHETDDS